MANHALVFCWLTEAQAAFTKTLLSLKTKNCLLLPETLFCCLLLQNLTYIDALNQIEQLVLASFIRLNDKCYISHGECDTAQLSYIGEIFWQKSGKDIFTGDFFLNEDFISVIDFKY